MQLGIVRRMSGQEVSCGGANDTSACSRLSAGAAESAAEVGLQRCRRMGRRRKGAAGGPSKTSKEKFTNDDNIPRLCRVHAGRMVEQGAGGASNASRGFGQAYHGLCPRRIRPKRAGRPGWSCWAGATCSRTRRGRWMKREILNSMHGDGTGPIWMTCHPKFTSEPLHVRSITWW